MHLTLHPRPAPAHPALTQSTPAARVAVEIIDLSEDAETRRKIRDWQPHPQPTQAEVNRRNAEAMLREGHDYKMVADTLRMGRPHVKRIAARLGLQ